MNRFLRGLSLFWKLNLIKTLWFNFKLLPLKDAVRLPILLFGKINISESTGSIELKDSRPGIMRVGYFPHRLFGLNYCGSLTRISIKGKMIVKGTVKIGNGSFIKVEESGILSLGSDVEIGPYARLYCKDKISIGNTCRFSWDCQIFDTDFHYIIDDSRCVYRNAKSVIIGDNVWVGNRVTIQKGGVIGDNSIIASNSLVNKNLQKQYGEGVFAGIPVNLVAKGRHRIFDLGTEKKLDEFFEKETDKRSVCVDELYH